MLRLLVALLGLSVFYAHADQITTGYAHSCHLNESENLMQCWGWNHYGQLGLGHNYDASGPKVVRLPSGKVTQIEGGGGSTCAIIDSKLFCWGKNSHGQLGLGDYDNRSLPTEVPLPGRVTQVSLGRNHSCAVINEGVMCWGFNYACQLGQKRCEGGSKNPHKSLYKPMWVMDLPSGSGVSFVEAGESNSCAIKNAGLYCWGSALRGMLGDRNRKVEYRPRPQAVPGHGEGSGVREVSLGHLHGCVNRRGMVRCWGQGTFLGVNKRSGILGPTVPKKILGTPLSNISTSDGTTCMTHEGRAQCWGDATFGALGTGKKTLFGGVPHPVAILRNITKLSTGDGHSCAIDSGQVYCWGWNNFCQVGIGKCWEEQVSVLAPAKVIGL